MADDSWSDAAQDVVPDMNDMLTHGLIHGTKMNRQGCTAYGVEPDMHIFKHVSIPKIKQRCNVQRYPPGPTGEMS